ncbi:MAG: DNA starvation/stationary phase protection protein [Leptospiraceae bacterium]|nr:DNA starvation/stationary phase protection protein [Leptospiraceae bacterium]MCP5512670.1 DNA starvation/stationary phase protection protein [Leptospiraceae bacterium]
MKIDIGIPENEREAIALGLKKVLADTYALYLKTHYYHWNVTGPMFDTLHKMFELQYNELWIAIDLIAERIRSLGYYAPGTYKEFSTLTSIEEDSGVPKANQMIENLVSGHERVVKTIRENYKSAENSNDQGTLDVFTQRLSLHEKTAWMLRSLLSE